MIAAQETSRIAYIEVRPHLCERQKKVLEVITKFGPQTNSEMAEKLGWTINTVTPRTNELVKKKLLREIDRRKCYVTGRQAIVWGKVYADTLF